MQEQQPINPDDKAAFDEYWKRVSATSIFGHFHTWLAACEYMRQKQAAAAVIQNQQNDSSCNNQ